MTYQKQWVERADNIPGYIYLMEAVGFHGIIPGCYLRRCKIGLSRNPQLRLENFHANQPPCDIRILKTIYVQDMEATEKRLHAQFQRCNVKLNRSREWFDLNPWDFVMVMWAMNRSDWAFRHCSSSLRDVSFPLASRPGFSKLLILSGLGLLLFTAISGQFQTSESQATHSVSRVVSSPVAHNKP